jgi:hypothetical protein
MNVNTKAVVVDSLWLATCEDMLKYTQQIIHKQSSFSYRLFFMPFFFLFLSLNNKKLY